MVQQHSRANSDANVGLDDSPRKDLRLSLMQRLLLFLTSLLAVLSVNSLHVNGPPSNPSLELGLEQVEARRGGGGRSRGGSFGRSRSRGSSRSRSGSRSSRRIGGSSGTSSGRSRPLSFFDFLIALIVVAIFLIRQVQEFQGNSNDDQPAAPNPDTWGSATVTKLQLALLGQVDNLHSELLTLSQRQPRTASDRAQLLQDTALALLRNPESWTHIWANSIHYNQAERVDKAFQHLTLLEERQNRPESFPESEGESEYVLVTLILVTDHLQPIFSPVHSEDEQKQALETLAALDSQCLGKLEVYVHPKSLGKNLTKEELVCHNDHLISL
ncbi:MAG: DUF1517 domain-containing protein [Phormidium sp. BM_Day4_Bin.17]|nr:DUF1517 domain-containing protein [Phormidium sp. BM_Day4_Bin.17]UCJ10598.1 MAG: DUF1517 domain-containing protein [Phormidium sp. PBR-2020]